MPRYFREGPIAGVIVDPLQRFGDGRGWLLEMFRTDELQERHLPAMAYVSETLPGVQRGPHEHVDQTDMFVFIGPGDFHIELWDNRPQSPTFDNHMALRGGAARPVRLIVPPGVVHGYRNVSDAPALVYNFPNRLYKGMGRSQPVDEVRHEQDPASPYHMA